MEKKFTFTKASIESLAPPDKDRITYHDTKQSGLQLRITKAGKKSFVARGHIHGRSIRVTLGHFPKVSVDDARRLTKKHLSTFADGKDPNAVKRGKQSKSITLQQCLDEYVTSHTNIKENTAKTYRNSIDKYLPDWLDTPMINIKRDDIEARHRKIGKTYPTSANKVMRILRALFEYAHGKYEDEDGNPIISHNPVRRLSHTKSWFKETRRTTFIKPSDLPSWYKSVKTAPNWLDAPDPDLIKDYLQLVLFTGLRRREAASLRWKWIDFEHQTLTIPETKNGYEHALPLSSHLFTLLNNRKDNDSDFVFPGSGKSGHFEEPKKSVDNIREHSGVYFTVHDLRRTFITIAESLGIRDYTLKRLLNHRSSGDVTDGYIMSDVERLREPMQQICNRIMELATIKASNE